MTIREDFNARLKEALKSKDEVAISTVRLIIAALKDRDISARGNGKSEGIDENEILSMLQSMIKQRQESAKTYCDAGREELAEREESEIEVIESFLPEQISDSDLEDIIGKLVVETGAESIRDMGKVMGVLKSQYAGQVDMGKAGAMVKERLG